MKVATWNVNSLRIRLPHLLEFLREEGCAVVGVQETKLPDDRFPADEIRAAGYEPLFSGQKTYNGVAILVKKGEAEASDPQYGIPAYPDPQKRLLAATITPASGAPFRFACAYFPNGTAPGTAKYLYKLEWIHALFSSLSDSLRKHPRLILAGDMNIAPEDSDIWDPKGWKGHILVSDAERDAFRSLLALGLRDTFRLKPGEPELWTWWDYRSSGFLKNQGARIDHILASEPLAKDCGEVRILTRYRALEQPSDHAPVVLTLKD
ncbi:MAG: exodeoxyribonuclease III [Sutterellaceae bacterium]|nr:exodeoxyribonuclease III [Sutterellaceae bacterium]MDD7441514.1 exodeoxyribonuclease III [Sutterellaceae bacterium]MDY2867348.1 exodeoxyribonuclease III [Mesosutterella sp.]